MSSESKESKDIFYVEEQTAAEAATSDAQAPAALAPEIDVSRSNQQSQDTQTQHTDWTQQEIEQLQKLVELRQEEMWRFIATELGKRADECRSCWQNLQRSDADTGIGLPKVDKTIVDHSQKAGSKRLKFGASTRSKAAASSSAGVDRETKSAKERLQRIEQKEPKADGAEVHNQEIESSSSSNVAEPSNSRKWTTLKHNGPLFPPEYRPHGIKVIYDGQPVDLTPEQEEVATLFAVLRDLDYYEKPKFRQNFWASWKELLGPDHVIQDLDKCDFSNIWKWHLDEKEKKKSKTRQEKDAEREVKHKGEEHYKYAIVDGRKEEISNFHIDPPGLFRGRGDHPLMGKLKKRVMPEDITINIGDVIDAPVPPIGHKWKQIISDPFASWLAMWKDHVTGQFKFIFFSAYSSMSARNSAEMFETARKVHAVIDRIRIDYQRDWDSSDEQVQQRAVAMYFIDQWALRVGNEKDIGEAESVGCCSLCCRHIKLLDDGKVEFDFTGKDSSKYLNTVSVDPKVHAILAKLKEGHLPDEPLYTKLSPTLLNSHLKSYMGNLTPKVLRIYNDSRKLEEQLLKNEDKVKGMTVAQMVLHYNRICKESSLIGDQQLAVLINNYFDPRIAVAWCKRHEVPIDKIMTAVVRSKFAWAMDTTGDFRFS